MARNNNSPEGFDAPDPLVVLPEEDFDRKIINEEIEELWEQTRFIDRRRSTPYSTAPIRVSEAFDLL